jgi:hypothetical protein
VARFKHVNVSTCDAPFPERHKTVTNMDITDQIHELILEDSRISTISRAEQLRISRERFGSIIHEEIDMRKLSAMCSRNALKGIKNFNAASRHSKF